LSAKNSKGGDKRASGVRSLQVMHVYEVRPRRDTTMRFLKKACGSGALRVIPDASILFSYFGKIAERMWHSSIDRRSLVSKF
jgi:hypothetical protein